MTGFHLSIHRKGTESVRSAEVEKGEWGRAYHHSYVLYWTDTADERSHTELREVTSANEVSLFRQNPHSRMKPRLT